MWRVYDVCRDCGEIVWWNKPLLGSAHFCVTEKEAKQYARVIRFRITQSKRRLEQLPAHKRRNPA